MRLQVRIEHDVGGLEIAVDDARLVRVFERDEHVRVDIFYREMSVKRRAIVNLFGVLFFIFPLCAFFVIEGLDYVSASWSIKEVSRNAGGLPFPFVPLLKSALLFMPFAVALQGLSMALRSVSELRGN